MEMANLTINLCDVPGESSDCADSTEAHNLTLHQCARYGDECNMLTELQTISGHVKEKMNALDDTFLTPLHYAIRYNHLSVVKLLVDAGADLNVKGHEDITPLHTAARYHRAKIKRMETNSPEEEESIKGSAAASGLLSVETSGEGCISFLIKTGAEVNVVDIYGQTPLHYAAMSGNENAARVLLNLTDIYLDAQDMQGVTALHTAAVHSQEGVAAMLIEAGANVRCKDIGMATPLHHACSKGNVSFVQMLFDAASGRAEGWVMVSSMLTDRDVEESTCLHLAVDNGHYDVAKLFLEKYADVNVPRKHDIYPLHLAAMSGDIRNVKLLVEHKARVDVLNDEQATPLHKAIVFNHLDVVQYLVDHGAKIDRRCKDNYTPLLLAVTHGHVETVELLLQKGADYTAVDKNVKTVIFLAAEENKAPVLKKLLSYPQVKLMIKGNESCVTNPVHVAAQEGYSEILVILLENGALPDSRNEEQQTPLHLAAMFGRMSNVRELVKRDKLLVNAKDGNSNTPLHLAAMQGHDKAVALLLEFGADVASRNYSLSTPLNLAASEGCLKACQLLLEHGATIETMDKYGTTPLHFACRNGHPAVVSLLIEWDANATLPDSEGLNSLSIAIENHNNDVAMVIINSEVWKDALRHASLDIVTGHFDTPMRKLIRKMPDVAERVFDRCLSYGAEKNPERPDYEITFNYEFLDDVYANWLDTKRESSSDTGSSSDYGVFDEHGRVLPSAKPYASDSSILKMNHPLKIMVALRRKDLLSHPLVMSMLNHKWLTLGCPLYIASVNLYLVFLTFLTTYIVETPPPYIYNSSDFAAMSSGSCDHLNTTYQQPKPALIAKYVVILLVVFNMLKELFQIFQARCSYFSWTNLIEWFTYISALLLVIDFNDCQKETGFRLFIQKFPMFGIYVVMLSEVLLTVIQVFVVFFLFIVAFSLGFYTVFQNQVAFQNVPRSIIKTGVMMIGEFEFDAIFNEQFKSSPVDYRDKVHFPEVAYVLFVTFLILVSIIVTNLLIGLAVADIKAVQDQSAFKKMAMQVDLALDVEKILPDFIRRKTYIRRETLNPNICLKYPLWRLWRLLTFQSSLSLEVIEKALHPELVQEGQG
ncbi:transient receptor potential cation channel subfamily A member 1 homolog isoform X2 [Haliotis rufescens]|uniref:transient receptor potential cation channel subfamily A member 1 homolog isoform X2 n=1 Tax=Haliotis rufescens TaxID=6454 RepID=UPI00201EFB22|nr:transient receptor potential cation channel subfamily A member 1 homolog isoform X2 [Haliotis rufescens]